MLRKIWTRYSLEEKGLINLFIISFILLDIISIQAQYNDTKFEQIPIGIARCFCQDSDGFLWVGSQEGLARYDGNNLKFYSQIPFDSTSLSNNWVTDIKEDKNGNLWIGTWGGGLNYFDKRTEKFTHFLQKSDDDNGIRCKNISSLVLNEDGTLWIASQEMELLHMRFDGTGKPIYKKYEFGNTEFINSKNYIVWCLFKDSEEILWVGTAGNGLFNLDPKTEKLIHYKYNPDNRNGIKSNIVTSICEDDSGNIWFTTNHILLDIPGTGLGRFNKKTGTFSYYKHNPEEPTSLCSNNTFCLYIDRSNTLWVGTNCEGICSVPLPQIYNSAKPVFTKYRDIPYVLINKIFEDRNNGIWIGLWAVYMARLDRKENPFIWYTEEWNNPNSLSSPGIESIFSDKDGNIWFGHHSTGLTKYNPQTCMYKHYRYNSNNENGISSNWINAICQDNDGKLWIGTWDNGIDILDPLDNSFHHIIAEPLKKYGLKSKQIRFLLKSRTGDIWISSVKDGLQMFDIDHRQFKSFDVDTASVMDEATGCLYEDSHGKIWIGTQNNGLYCVSIENKEITTVKHFKYNPNNKNSLSSNNILDVTQSTRMDSNYLWIATNIGLNKFNLRTKTFTHYFKKDGLPHNYVLKVLEDNQGNIWATTAYHLCVYDSKTEKFNSYGKTDGLSMNDFGGGRQNSTITQDGQLIFGGGHGAIGFYPEEVMNKSPSAKIYFTDFKIFNKSIQLDTALTYKKRIQIPYDQNAISFEFTDLNFSPSNRDQFTYKMEGLYEDWINIGDKRNISFTNLEPGKYNLRVKFANVEDISPNSEASILLIIFPPWWQTWWFRSTATIFLIMILYGIYKYRVNKLLEIERMRVQIASDLHDDVGASLTKIAVHSEIIQSTKDRKKIIYSSAKIGNMSREIITSLSDIIWSIDARNDKVGDLIDRMRDYLETVFPPGSIRTNFQTCGLEFYTSIDQVLRQNIYLIFKEAINNAAKHSHATEVNIQMTNGDGKFNLEISDNGKGIVLNEKSSGSHGLQNMKLRAERIGGVLKIENNNGTKITLIVKEL